MTPSARVPRPRWVFSAAIMFAGCQGGDQQAPPAPDLAIAKPDTLSGDAQVGVAGSPLGRPLRVVVTENGRPVRGVTVAWTTPEGTITPASGVTDADGVSSAAWSLKLLYAQQVAFAAIGQPGGVGVGFTAIATPDPSARTTVLVGPDGANRFVPADLTIAAGDTVNWLWPEGSEGHNIVPDDGDSPPQSGALAGYPRFHSFRFDEAGVFHYHCMAHGDAGMTGTITVEPQPSTN